MTPERDACLRPMVRACARGIARGAAPNWGWTEHSNELASLEDGRSRNALQRRGPHGGSHGASLQRFSASLIAAAIAVGAVATIMTPSARAQTLDLDGVPAGPSIPADCGASEASALLESEAKALRAEAAVLAGEARDAAEAKARLRTLASYLLQSGAGLPWDRSAPVVLGTRLSMLVGRADRLVDSATQGVNPRTGNPLSPAQVRASIEAVRTLAAMDFDEVRRAVAIEDPSAQWRVVDALSKSLAPLVALVRSAEGLELPEPWPIVDDARDAVLERVDAPVSLDEVRASARSLAEGSAARIAAERAIDAVAARGGSAQQASDLRALKDAVESLGWIRFVLDGRPPRPAPEAALEAAERRVLASVELFGAADGAGLPSARARLAALDDCLEASRLLAEWRRDPGAAEVERRSFSAAISALLAAELPSEADERLRTRAAQRIVEVCRVARTLETAAGRDPPRDLRDAVRQLDRKAKIALDALPAAIEQLACDPSKGADPAIQSALERVRTLEEDRRRIGALQQTIDRIAAIRPAAAEGFARQARRMARMLTDDATRGDAQAAFASLERQCARVFPLPYEAQLKERGPRAQALTGGNSARVAEIAGSARSNWAAALARADFAGADAQRLDAIARFCAVLADLDSIEDPVTRDRGDRLALWGGWASRRAALAPASKDLGALCVLASRSLVAARDEATWSTFRRDLESLERSVPLVQLAARLESRISPILRGDPATVAAALAPVVIAPAPESYLAREWTRLLAVDRALLELEFARRKSEQSQRTALEEYLARLAGDLQASAFGAPKPLAQVPGFDGKSAPGDTRADDKSKPRAGRSRS